MIEILLKASFAIVIAFLFYKLLLQQESFFAANRFYLIGCIALAFALPFVTFPPLVSQQGYLSSVFQQIDVTKVISLTKGVGERAQDMETQRQQAITVSPEQTVEENPSSVGAQGIAYKSKPEAREVSWMFWLSMLYLFGVAVFTLSLLFQISLILYRVITATDKIQNGDCVIVNMASRQAPCSFFRYIFIYPDDYDFETYEQIIAHEKIHARLGHSLDLLVAEIAVILLWFNPLIWLFKREVEKNNEYQTDAMLLEKEKVSRNQYQMSLLQIAAPNKPLSITTNYNQSLLKQRIVMMNAKKSTPHAYWKYVFLVPLFFGTILLMNEPAASMHVQSSHTPADAPQETNTVAVIETVETKPGKTKPEKDKVKEEVKEKTVIQKRNSLNIKGAQVDMSEGFWYSRLEGGEYCIDFKGNKNSSGWNMTRCFDRARFQKSGNQAFVMTNEIGTLLLAGNLEAEVSQGKYTFTEDASFKQYLTNNNIVSRDKNLMFHLFFSDVNKQYFDFLKKNYTDLEGDRLLELAIHGISMNDFQNFLVLFQKHSNQKPSIREVVEAKIHGIDEVYVQEIQRMGFGNLSLKKMMEAKIHGVSASYVESLKSAGFGNITIDQIIAAKIHDVNPASIKGMQSLGFGELSLDKMMELQIHGVTAAYINDLKSAGFENVTVNQAIEAKIHNLTPSSIKEIRALGYKDLTFKDMVSAQIHDVDAAYVADLKKAGFQNLTMNKTVEAKIHGIDSEFITKARQNGYNLNSIDKYISLKIHGMAMESLKEK